jgi:hypothetical protein
LQLKPHSHAFESLSTTAIPPHQRTEARRSIDPVNLHTLWYTAITRTLGGIKLLLIGEVDWVKGFFTTLPPFRRPDILSSGGLDEYHGTESPEHYLELKTQKQSHNSKKYAIDIPYTSNLTGSSILKIATIPPIANGIYSLTSLASPKSLSVIGTMLISSDTPKPLLWPTYLKRSQVLVVYHGILNKISIGVSEF